MVLREGVWTERSTEDLVPGDLVSITRLPGGVDTPIPCDCLILRGSAVVNEASLTGGAVAHVARHVMDIARHVMGCRQIEEQGLKVRVDDVVLAASGSP